MLCDSESKRPTFIYALTDPTNHDEIRYVGATLNPKWRQQAHMTPGVNDNKSDWTRKLRRQGLRPGFAILEKVDTAEARQKEYEWINLLLSSGHRLFNCVYKGISRKQAHARIATYED